MRIIFVRHGEPNYQKDCLTELGRKQAEAAAERLRGEGIDTVFTSPYGRALQTAEITAERLNLGPVKVLDFMHELHWGSKSGDPIFADGHPWEIADELSRTGWDLTRPDWAEHPLYADNRVVESANLVAEKTDEWMASLGYERDGAYYRCVRENSRTVALFSHGGSSVAMIGRMMNLAFPYCCAAMHFHFTGVTILRFDRREGSRNLPVIELFNDGAHIRELPSELP